MKWWKQKRRELPAPVVQVRRGGSQPFGVLDRYVPLGTGEMALYRAIREGVPIVDAAIWKLVRLCGGVGVKCANPRAQRGLEEFFRTVDTGWGQRGMQAFLAGGGDAFTASRSFCVPSSEVPSLPVTALLPPPCCLLSFPCSDFLTCFH